MTPFRVRVRFHGDLSVFIKGKASVLERPLTERTSVKDVIEACGVPHTEVDLILVDAQPVDFSFVIAKDGELAAYSVEAARLTFFPEHHLQIATIEKFVADGHLGKLTRDLRLLGLDVAYDTAADDHQLVRTAKGQERALLTRDRRLLMHGAVLHGYFPRSQDPLEQTREVLRRYQLADKVAPFSRCLRCNQRLEKVTKTEVIGQLEPLTRIYYEEFRRCPGCDQVYWPGSHFKKLEARIAKLRQRL